MSNERKDIELKATSKRENISEDASCGIIKNENIHLNKHKLVDDLLKVSNALNDEQVESSHKNKDEEDPVLVQNIASKYASFLRQLKFVTLIGLCGTIMGTFLAYPAVALTEDGSDIDGIQLSAHYTKWFVSIPLLVCIPGCLVAGTVVEVLGMRLALAGCWVLAAVSWTIITVTTAIPALIITRILQGIAMAVYLVAIMYTVEISSTKYRGFFMSLGDTLVYFGIMATYALPLFINSRYLGITLGLMFLVPHGIGLYISPDSPVWLMRKNRLDKSKKALIQLRDSKESVNQEILDIENAVKEENSVSTSVYEQLLLISNPSVWKPMILCILLVSMKELTGQSAVTSYTVFMFKMTKTTLDPYWCTAAIGVVRLLSCFLNMGLIQVIPRKVLLSGGFILSSIAMVIMAIPLLIKTNDIPEYLPDWLPLNPEDLPDWFPLLGLVMFSIVYTGCVNPTAWALVAEMTPTSIKSVGGGIITALFATIQFLVGLTFLDLVDLLGAGGVFLMFALFGLIGGIMVIFCFPETSGKSLAQLKYNSSVDEKF